MRLPSPRPSIPVRGLASLVPAAILATGCAIGPDPAPPVAGAPPDWTSWRSSPALVDARLVSQESPRPDWWRSYGDPVLDDLVAQARSTSPDLQTTALRLAQARVQRRIAGGEGDVQVSSRAAAARQRQSENGASTRLLDALGGANRDALVGFLSEPFTVYQAGFDVSWEPDFWGRVRRSVEAADAELRNQEALAELATLSLVADLVRSYFEVRQAQRDIALLRADANAADERLQLVSARVSAGLLPATDLSRQRAEWAAVQAQLPAQLAREGAAMNQLAVLAGLHPGALNASLRPAEASSGDALPDLSLGLPSEVALRRPDVRAALARVLAATARIGVARADLYPSIRLGASLGRESLRLGDLADWGSRTWSIGPTLSLPLFDGGRRRGAVQLRELEQQQAAVQYQQVVLGAWREIDDALSGYEADRLQLLALQDRVRSADDAYALLQARYESGLIPFFDVIDAQRGRLQAQRDLVAAQARARTRFAQVNKAIGNVPGP